MASNIGAVARSLGDNIYLPLKLLLKIKGYAGRAAAWKRLKITNMAIYGCVVSQDCEYPPGQGANVDSA